MTLKVIGPSDDRPPEGRNWLAGLAVSPPSPSTVEPPPGQAQDIALGLPPDGDGKPIPLTLTFDMSRADVPDVVAATCDSVYVMAGMPGLVKLGRALTGGPVPPVHWSDSVSRGLPRNGRGEKRYRDKQRSPFRHRLLTAHWAYLEGFDARRDAAVAAVAGAAVALARERLAASRKQVLAETMRYLPMPQADDAVAVLDGTRPAPGLTGDDARRLVVDLALIAGARDARARAEIAEIAAVRSSKQDMLDDLAGDLDKWAGRRGYPLSEREILEAYQDAYRSLEGSDSPKVTAARQATSDRQAELARLVAESGGARPLLFRIWNTEAPYLARTVVRPGPTGTAAVDSSALIQQWDLREIVVDTLRTTWTAQREMAERLDSDPSVVWHFPALIDQALAHLRVDRGDFAGRAALDRVAEDEPARSLNEISTWIGYVELAAAVTGLGPVAVAAAVTQILVDVAAIAVKLWRMFEEQTAADAFLIPSARFAVPPTYSSLALDLFLVGISVAFTSADIARLRKP